jgi:hypothetical protein
MNVLRDPSSCVSAPSYSTPAKAVVFQTPATRNKIWESDSRMLADCRHDRQVLDKMVFTAFMFVVTILSAIFTTVLELPREESWRQSFASFSEGSEKLQLKNWIYSAADHVDQMFGF